MPFKRIVRGVIGFFHKLEAWSAQVEERVYEAEEPAREGTSDEIHSVWDYLKFKPNTQAFHLATVLGFDEWVDMNEIRRRVKELFGVEYKNERSLYPYLKTLTDIGIIESSSVGGRMQWRKYDLLVKIEKEAGEMGALAVQAKSKEKKQK